MISGSIIAPALVAFSTVGFVIVFGIATVVPMIYELAIIRKEESVKLLHRYPYRFISRLCENWSIIILILISLLYVIVSLLSLIYFLLDSEIVIIIDLAISILISILLILYVVCISLCALPFKKDEVYQIAEYMNDGFKK